MTLTLSRSINSCALVLAPAGLPPVSAEMKSILRPASVLFFCLRKVAMPCSIWMPPWARGPVLTVSRPVLKAAPWAGSTAGTETAATPVAARPFNTVLRLILIDVFLPSDDRRRTPGHRLLLADFCDPAPIEHHSRNACSLQ